LTQNCEYQRKPPNSGQNRKKSQKLAENGSFAGVYSPSLHRTVKKLFRVCIEKFGKLHTKLFRVASKNFTAARKLVRVCIEKFVDFQKKSHKIIPSCIEKFHRPHKIIPSCIEKFHKFWTPNLSELHRKVVKMSRFLPQRRHPLQPSGNCPGGLGSGKLAQNWPRTGPQPPISANLEKKCRFLKKIANFTNY